MASLRCTTILLITIFLIFPLIGYTIFMNRNNKVDEIVFQVQLKGNNDYSDDFNGGVVDSKWNWHPDAGTLANYSSTGSAVRITCPQVITSWQDGVKDLPYLYQSLPLGDWEIIIKVNKPAANEHANGIILYKNDTRWIMFANHYDSVGEMNLIRGNLTGTPDNYGGGGRGGNEPYLKLKKVGNNYSCYRSPDNSFWNYSGCVITNLDFIHMGFWSQAKASGTFISDFDYFSFQFLTGFPWWLVILIVLLILITLAGVLVYKYRGKAEEKPVLQIQTQITKYIQRREGAFRETAIDIKEMYKEFHKELQIEKKEFISQLIQFCMNSPWFLSKNKETIIKVPETIKGESYFMANLVEKRGGGFTFAAFNVQVGRQWQGKEFEVECGKCKKKGEDFKIFDNFEQNGIIFCGNCQHFLKVPNFEKYFENE